MSTNSQTEVFERMDIHNMLSFNQHLLQEAEDNKATVDLENIYENQEEINYSFLDISTDFKSASNATERPTLKKESRKKPSF